MTRQKEPRPSLLDLFALRDDRRRGVFGLVCGLSADEYFMDKALEKFSGLSKTQRQHNGHMSIALFLDAHNEPMQDMHGLYIPWQSRPISGKNGLMHAKTALLGFGESTVGEPDYYRLIVSTGNWTVEAVDHSINLVWSCDYDTASREDQKQSAKDIVEAAAFWRKLLGINSGGGYYQIDGIIACGRIEKFLKQVSDNVRPPQRGYAPQFISNLLDGKADKRAGFFNADSMGAQVLKHFYSSRKKRNFIICGSGFFEQANPKTSKPKKPEQEPEVLCKTIEHLKKRILTEKAEQWLVVNPDTSGAAGQWIKSNNLGDWSSIHPPKHPDIKEAPYPFHAKYIFLGNYNYTNTPITGGILYIGSGNLSRQGFVLGPGTGGNIEAGVVMTTERFLEIAELCKQLGIDAFDKELKPKDIPDQPEGEESEPPSKAFQSPPPIAACIWQQEADKLQWEKWDDVSYTDVLLHGQNIKSPDCTEIYVDGKDADFSGGVKLSARKDGKRHSWAIPVFRDNGTFWSPPAQPRRGQEIIDALADFPQCSRDETDDAEDTDDVMMELGRISSAPTDDMSEFRDELDGYPLHLATALIETIADQNQQITSGQMPDWIEHLRRTLIDEMKPKTKEGLAELGKDVLYPLIKTQGFAPLQAGTEYRKALQDISEDWSRVRRSSQAEKD